MIGFVGLWLGVLLCGGLGATLRVVIDDAITRRLDRRFPVGILVVNVSGAFLLGVIDGWVLPPHLALLVGTGVIGAYTTFSTWIFESERMLSIERIDKAVANLVLSTAFGLLLAAAGLWVGARL